MDGGYEATCIVTVTERFADEYQINSITVRDSDGFLLSALPDEGFLATVSITNLASEGNILVLLAAYTDEGQYQGMMWVSIEDFPIGSTCKVTLPVNNTDGKIANLKVFTVASFESLTPLGDVVSFRKYLISGRKKASHFFVAGRVESIQISQTACFSGGFQGISRSNCSGVGSLPL